MNDGDTELSAALARRLRSIAPYLLGEPLPEPGPDPSADAAAALDLLATQVATRPDPARVWLLVTGLCAAYPTRDEMDRVRRALELSGPSRATVTLLRTTLPIASTAGAVGADAEVLPGAVLVDVDHSAKHALHTGIQRVTRSLMPRWHEHGRATPVAWTRKGGAFRRLSTPETTRVMAWGAPPESDEVVNHDDDAPGSIVIPWHGVVVMAEVPRRQVSERLAAIGDRSGNTLVGIAYDAIPIVSADLVPPEDTTKFVSYLTAVKFSSRMAGISRAAADELAGFVYALRTQGLAGPEVAEIALPTPAPLATVAVPRREPHVLVVGSHEPRKNHLAVLHCAEVLWREGHDFSLTFVGGSGWGDEFPRVVAGLARAGRPVTVRRAVSDGELEAAYAKASFTVFPSLHEGFGLPVAESLARGVPVIATGFGSTAEIGAGGGALLVNPRDDRSLTDAMRTLLCDEAALAALRTAIGGRVGRDWQEYADELWAWLVLPVLTGVDRTHDALTESPTTQVAGKVGAR